MKKHISISFRVSEEQKDKFDELVLKSGVEKSDYIRSAIFEIGETKDEILAKTKENTDLNLALKNERRNTGELTRQLDAKSKQLANIKNENYDQNIDEWFKELKGKKVNGKKVENYTEFLRTLGKSVEIQNKQDDTTSEPETEIKTVLIIENEKPKKNDKVASDDKNDEFIMYAVFAVIAGAFICGLVYIFSNKKEPQKPVLQNPYFVPQGNTSYDNAMRNEYNAKAKNA
jgi:predicted DNA-binding protein